MELKYTNTLLPGMLLEYDCVIIPGLGGFVCNERSAWYDEEKEEMVPPSKDVLFNPNLTHNDGLLAQEIIRLTGATLPEAMKIAEEESSQILETIHAGEAVELAKVGRIYKGADGVLRFAPNAELVRTLRSFGHTRIPLAQIKQAAKPTTSFTRVAAALAIPLAMGLALGGALMVTDSSSSSTLMGLFPSPEVIISNFSPSEDSELVTVSEEEPAIEIEYVEAPAEQPIEQPVEVVVEQPQINFLIIGGAFSIEANAQTLAEELKSEGYNPTHHFQSHNGLHLVALGAFTDEQDARRAMAKARKKGRRAAWLKKLS